MKGTSLPSILGLSLINGVAPSPREALFSRLPKDIPLIVIKTRGEISLLSVSGK